MEQFYTGSLIGKTLFAKTAMPVYNSTATGSAVAFTVKPGSSAGTIKAVVNGYGTNSGNQYFMINQPNGKVYFVPINSKIDEQSLIKQGAITLADKAKKDADFDAKENGGFAYYAEKWLPRILLGVGAVIIGKQYVQSKLSR